MPYLRPVDSPSDDPNVGGSLSFIPSTDTPAFWFGVYVLLALMILGVIHLGFRGVVAS